MRKATKKDRNTVVSIIAESFEQNPSYNWAIKQDKKRSKRLYELAKYAFSTAHRRKGVYISSDEQGVILFYKQNEYKERLIDYYDQAKLALKATGISLVPFVLKTEAYKKKIRPKNGEFLYCWFYGVKIKSRGKGAAYEMKNYLADVADKMKLPVYVETSVLKNTIAYKRWGYETYHKWEIKDKDKTLWFMKREPKTEIEKITAK